VAIEIVQAVRQAEQDAAKLEKEAALKAEAIIQKANEDAKSLISSMTKEVLAKAEKDLEQVQLQGAELMVTAVQKAEKEILLLKEIVKGKEETAINLVLSEVI
jgi:V/A-type H+/Na+-transporting ATPase subunit G/H